MATRSLGSLTIDLIAKTGMFEAGMDRAARLADRRSRDISKSISNGLKGALGSVAAFTTGLVGGLLSAQAAFEGFMNAINNADRLDELSARLGISTEQLSAWGYAAKLSGTDLESLTGSIQKFSKTVASAADANSRQAELFASIGISVKDAAGNLRDVEDLLPEVADRFKALDNETTETALAMELFGRSGAELLEFLNRGSDGLNKLGEEARDLGGIIDGETAKAAAEFKDQVDQLRVATNALFTQIARELLPDLKALTAQLIQLSKETDGVASTVRALVDVIKFGFEFSGLNALVEVVSRLRSGFEATAEAARGLANLDFGRIRNAFNQGQSAFFGSNQQPANGGGRARNARGGSNRPETGGNFSGLQNSVNRYLADPNGSAADKAAREAARRAKELEREAEKIAKAIRKMADAQRDWTTELEGTGNPILDDYQRKLDAVRTAAEEYKALKVPKEEVAAFTSEMERLALAIKDKELAEFQREFALDTKSAENSLLNASNASVVYQKALYDLDKQLKQGLITQQLYDERLSTINANRHAEATQLISDMKFEIALLGMTNLEREKAIALRGLDSETTAKYSGAISDLVVEMDKARKSAELWDGIQQSLADNLFDAITGAESLTDAVRNFFEEVANMLLRQTLEKLSQQITDAFQASANSGQSGQGWGAALASFFSTAFGGARANGGPVQAGVPYLVGERGPELFVAPKTGTIVPNNKMGMGVTQVNNFAIQGRIDRRTEDQIVSEVGRKSSVALRRNN